MATSGVIDSTPWAHRSHSGRRPRPIELSPGERRVFEAACRRPDGDRRIALRAQAVLLMADHVPNADIARLLAILPSTVSRLRRRFRGPDAAARLADARRSGRPRS